MDTWNGLGTDAVHSVRDAGGAAHRRRNDEQSGARPLAAGRLSSRHPPPPPRWREHVMREPRFRLHLEGDPRVARDLMTREILTIGPDDTLEQLEGYMKAFRFRHLPVVEGDVLVGLITLSDLLRVSSSALSTSATEENRIIHSLPARRIMSRDFVAVHPTEPLAGIASALWETRVECLPVTEEDRTLVGMITESDFVRLAHHLLTRSDAA